MESEAGRRLSGRAFAQKRASRLASALKVPDLRHRRPLPQQTPKAMMNLVSTVSAGGKASTAAVATGA